MPLDDPLPHLTQDGVCAAAARGAANERDDAEPARERAAVLDPDERPDPVEARVRLDAAERADVAGDERSRLLGALRDDGHVRGQSCEPAWSEIRGTTGQVDAPVGAGGARGGLAALREPLVRHAAAVDDNDVRAGRCFGVAVGEQAFADLASIDVRDLAAEEFDAEPHRRRDRTVAERHRCRVPPMVPGDVRSPRRGGSSPNVSSCGATSRPTRRS